MAEREQELREWASQIDWLHTHAVVCIGYSDIEPWTVLREWRSDMRVIVFEPDAAKAAQMPDAPDGCAVVSHLVDLR